MPPPSRRCTARFVAATNRDLRAEVTAGRFRGDLFYRLNVVEVALPPLRDRREDIPLLVRYFVQQYARRLKRTITSIPTEAMTALTRYAWPGNVRELENVIERSVLLSPGPVLRVALDDLKSPLELPDPAATTLADAERDGRDQRDRGATRLHLPLDPFSNHETPHSATRPPRPKKLTERTRRG